MDISGRKSLSRASNDAQESLDLRVLLLVLACAVGLTFDLSEISFGAALSGVFSVSPYSIPASQLSWLLASTYLGAVLGPPILGVWADRNGRRGALSITLFALGLLSLACVASPGIRTLIVLRALSGIALGAYPPLMFTYLTDNLPARLRGRLIMMTVAIAYLGPPLTLFLMRWLTASAPFGLAGWRWVIGLDGVGALLSGVLFLLLPESVGWRRVIMPSIRMVPASRRRLGFVAALSFLAPWATVTFPLLVAAFLVMRGISLSNSLLYVGVSTFGLSVGSGLVASVADRVQRRTAVVACALGMLAAAVCFSRSEHATGLTVCGFAFNLCVAIYMPALNTYVAELFPIFDRGRATSLAWSANRLAAAVVPLAMLPLLHARGEHAVFVTMTATLIASVLFVLAFGPARDESPSTAGLAVGSAPSGSL